MRIYTKITGHFDSDRLIIDSVDTLDYIGEVALLCGATTAQNQAQVAQASAYTTMTQQAQQVFGNDSSVFKNLQSTFAPTVAAGPNQEGFSAAEKSNLNSQAITNNGQAYKNAKAAVGESIAAQGGGNNAALQSGVNAGVDANLAISSANNTANDLGQINEADYQTGRQNYDNATAGLLNSTNSFSSATAAGGAATGAGTASADTANQIASSDNSWIQSVTGALGGVAGAVATGGMSNLGKGVGFFGKN